MINKMNNKINNKVNNKVNNKMIRYFEKNKKRDPINHLGFLNLL